MKTLLRLGFPALLLLLIGGIVGTALVPRWPALGLGAGVGVALAALVALRLLWARITAFPGDEYGPLPHDAPRYAAYKQRIRREERDLYRRLRVQETLRASVAAALSAGKRATADARLATAREALEHLRGEPALGRRARRAMERRFARDLAECATVKYENEARGHLERAAGLETARGREAARSRALAVLGEGLADPAADRARLERWALQHLTGDTGGAEPDEPGSASSPLARCVAEGRPLPVAVALRWLDEERGGREHPVRTRCPAELEELFRMRYRERFELDLDPPDPDRPAPSRARCLALADECCRELEAFARRRAQGGAADLAALAALPAALLASRTELPWKELRARARAAVGAGAPGGRGRLEARELRELWPGGAPPTWRRKEAVQCAALLAKAGFGVEPDPRFGGPVWRADDELVVFDLPAGPFPGPSPRYAFALLVVHLAVVVSQADGVIARDERERLRSLVDEVLELEPAERVRLSAHVTWLLEQPATLAGIQRRLESIGAGRREELLRTLVLATAADGRLRAPEVRTLERIYRALGVDAGRVHDDMHAARAATTPSSEPTAGARELRLDSRILASKRAETRAVSALLGEIFGGAEAEPAADAPADELPTCAGLDGPHSALLRTLATRASWTRAELEASAEGLGLLPDGALDALNEAAFDILGTPLWEGEDPIEIDLENARELLL